MLTIIFISWLAGIATQFLVARYLWPYRHRSYTWIFSFRNHREPGEPCKTDQVLDRVGFSIGYSYKRKSALWASYIISSQSVGIDHPRSNSFYADIEIPFKYRVMPEEFEHSGYDKGHLVPSASVDFSRKSNKQTFAMSNIVLQDPGLNRHAWGHLERRIREWTDSKGKLYIITGPIYGKRNKRVGDLYAPRQFYKIIYDYNTQKCIGFLFPNKEVSNDKLWKHAISVQDIEEQTGYTFFKGFVHDMSEAKSKCEVEWWQEGKE
jgi:endonuclease G